MASIETTDTITPKYKIIANQAAQLVTLQHKLNHLEDIGNKYEEQKKLLDDAIKAKHALQEIFFNTTQEKRHFISKTKQLQDVINERDYILKQCKDDNALEIESINRLKQLEINCLKQQYGALHAKSECCIDTIHTEHAFKCGLNDIKYDTLSTKYKFIKSENRVLRKQLKALKTQLNLMQKDNSILQEYEGIIVSLLEDAHSFEETLNRLRSQCATELNEKHSIFCELMEENDVIRTMYDRLKRICHDQDNKLIRIIGKNNKLNTIIEQNDLQNEKMQKHFQKDIANKERSIVKLETKLDSLASSSNTHQNVNDTLKQEHEVLSEQILSLRNERELLKQEIQHLEDKLHNKDDYVSALKKQIQDNNENISKLHDENSAMQALNESIQIQFKSTLNTADIKYKKLSEKYQGHLVKLQKMADKLRQQIEGRKKMKRLYVETKQQLQKVLKDNERIEKETDKQCDAVQESLEGYKNKIVKKNKEIRELEDTMRGIEDENRSYKEEILMLQKENDNHKFLIEHLEIDNNEQNTLAQKARQVRKQNRSVFNQIINENSYSQSECNVILKEIEHGTDDEEDEDEDDDLKVQRLSGNKRLREDDDDDAIGSYEAPMKKVRVSGERERERESERNKRSDATPFKGNKVLFRERKKRNRNNVTLPKPKIK